MPAGTSDPKKTAKNEKVKKIFLPMHQKHQKSRPYLGAGRHLRPEENSKKRISEKKIFAHAPKTPKKPANETNRKSQSCRELLQLTNIKYVTFFLFLDRLSIDRWRRDIFCFFHHVITRKPKNPGTWNFAILQIYTRRRQILNFKSNGRLEAEIWPFKNAIFG